MSTTGAIIKSIISTVLTTIQVIQIYTSIKVYRKFNQKSCNDKNCCEMQRKSSIAGVDDL